MKLSLKNRNIPRNAQGDPNFTQLYSEEREGENSITYKLGEGDLLDVFSPSEIVELVNRSLYQLEYQANSHHKYRAERLALEKPVREMFHTLYPKESWAKATNDQLSRCIEELKQIK